MKKNIFITIIIFSVFSKVSSGGFFDYLENCNFSIGFNYPIGYSISIADSQDVMYLKDGFGDYYSFYYDSGELKKIFLPLTIDLKFPFFYNDKNALGIGLATNLIYYSIGISSLDLFYSYNISPKFQISVFGGWSASLVNGSMGKLKRAFPGDPGFYTGGKFIKPGTEMTYSGIDPRGYNLGLSLKYRPFKNDKLFFLLGYRYTSSFSISEYKVKLGSTSISSNDIKFGTFNISDTHFVFLTFGWGA